MTARHRSGFCADEDGSATIEFLLWLPILMFILALMIDASMAFARQSHIWRVATEVSRSLSTGTLKASEVTGRVAAMSQGITVYSAKVTQNGALVTTTISVPLMSAAFMGLLGRFTQAPITASVTMEVQPHVQSIN